MKKADSFYLTEKQTKKMNKGSLRTIFAVLLFIMSCVSGILSDYAQNHTVEMILTGITGFGALGSVIVLVSGAGKAGGSFNPEFEKEIEEARTETGYFGKEK